MSATKHGLHGNRDASAVVVATALAIRILVIGQADASDMPASVDAARLNSADHDAANWLSHGRTYGEQRFSPLTEITSDNAPQLGLAWFADLDTNRGGGTVWDAISYDPKLRPHAAAPRASE